MDIVGGEDQARFSINSTTGALTFLASPNYGAPSDNGGDNVYDIVVQASDGANATTKAIAISVTDVNEPPTFLSFTAKAIASSTNSPYAISIGDFNEDGKADLVVANYDQGAVTILLGHGDGTFTSQATLATGNRPYSVAVGDFNHDGHQDVVVANDGDDSVSVLFGDGAGTFQDPLTLRTGRGPEAIAVADVNGDGTADIVVANSYANTVSVHLSNGDGTFQNAVNVATGSGPASVAVGDFNHDGYQDLIVANYNDNTVSVLLGDGDGGFQHGSTCVTGNAPVSIAVGDFNHDGLQDFVVANHNDTTVSIFLGRANGGFDKQQTFQSGTQPYSVSVSDFNADGRLDLVVANFSNNSVSVLLGNGDGTFAGPVSFQTGRSPDAVLVGDFGGDAKSDIVVANLLGGNVSVLLNASDASVFTPENVSTSTVIYKPIVMDPDARAALIYSISGGVDKDLFNIDPSTGALTFKASPDFETPAHPDNVYNVTLQVSDGELSATQAVAITVTDVKEAPTGQIAGYAYVDQNGDNVRDTGDGSLANLYVLLYDTSNGHLIGRVAPDADGHYIFTGVVDGTYRLSFDDLGGYLADQGTVDSTGSLVVENVVVQNGGLSTVDEGFYKPIHLGGHVSIGGIGIDGVEIDLLDANHNLVASTHSSNGLYNFDNLKPGAYFESVVAPHGYVTHQPHQVTLESGQNVTNGDFDLHRPVHDFNGDGLSDILFQNETANGAVYIWAMDGTNISSVGSGMPGIAGADWAVKGVGDFNGDGKSEIFFQNTASGGYGAVYIWAMDEGRIAGDGTGFVAPAGSDWVVKGVGDFNGDGKSDIVFQNIASADGAVYIWSMDGTTILNNGSGLPGVAGKDWVIKGVGDFNGDGKSDLLFQNANADGAIYVWGMNGASIQYPGTGLVAIAGADWHGSA